MEGDLMGTNMDENKEKVGYATAVHFQGESLKVFHMIDEKKQLIECKVAEDGNLVLEVVTDKLLHMGKEMQLKLEETRMNTKTR